MNSKEFNLLMSLILKMLENGQVNEVIELIKEATEKEKSKDE